MHPPTCACSTWQWLAGLRCIPRPTQRVQPVMLTVRRLLAPLLLLAYAAAADPLPRVNLFPSSAVTESGTPLPRAVAGGVRELSFGDAERVAHGSVAPIWRAVERGIAARFQPSVKAIADGPRFVAAARQLGAARPRTRPGEPTPRTFEDEVSAQILACQDAFDEPARWRQLVIEVAVDAEGVLGSAEVVLPSGSARLDQAALDAVRAAASAQPLRDPRGPVVARFRVEAARAVPLPRLTPVFKPGTGRVQDMLPMMPFRFDESARRASLRAPLSDGVRTRVTLLSVARAP